jgi:DNA-binding IclR family transcriptional regulator
MKQPKLQNLSVGKAVAILEYLAEIKAPANLGDICAHLDINKSTGYRFLSTLTELGYVYQDPVTSFYSLGARTAWLGMKYLESVEIREVARPILEKVAETTGETIHLGILDRNEVVYVDKVPSQQAVEMKSRVGGRMLIYSTALGRVLLANRPESEWYEYLKNCKLEPRTATTITEKSEFINLLQKARDDGYVIDNCENEADIRCVAAPVFSHSGEVVAAVSASGSTISMTMKKVEEIIDKVQAAGRSISEVLGADPEQLK